MHDIITIGDAFEDVFIESKEIEVSRDEDYLSGKSVSFELGEKIPLKSVEYEIGGSACNAAVGFSRLGLETSLITALGEDSPAERIKECLYKEGVDQANLKTIKSIRSNFSVVFRVGEARTIFVYRSLDDFSSIRVKKQINSRWFFLCPIGENAENLERDLIEKAEKQDAKIIWNPGRVQIKQGASKLRNLLKWTSVLFLNKEEAIRFLNYPVRPVDDEILKKLHVLGPKIVVMTNGKEGAKAYDGQNYYRIKSLADIKKVDATGAGDSFSIGFSGKLMSAGWNGEINSDLISEALKWGISNANSVLGFVGAQKGLLSHSAIVKEANSRRFELTIR